MIKGATKQQLGFTLIEALVYVTISSVLLVVITSLGYNVFVNRQKVLAGEEIIENANLVFAKIEHSIRKAESVILPVDSGNELSLEVTETLLNPTRFYLDGSTIFFAEGTGSGTAITTNAIEVTSLNFLKLVNDISGISINVTMTLASSRAGVNTGFNSSFNLPR